MKSLRQSIWAVALGVLLALGVALLLVFGILAPLFTAFMGGGRFGLEMAGPTVFPMALLVFSAAFSFYWGGMISSYRAPKRRRLHGTLVAPAAFAVSPVINVLSGNGIFPGLETAGQALFMVGVLLVAAAGAYVGARRGEVIHAHNQEPIRRRRLRESRRSPESG
jgi:hypothetical protein